MPDELETVLEVATWLAALPAVAKVLGAAGTLYTAVRGVWLTGRDTLRLAGRVCGLVGLSRLAALAGGAAAAWWQRPSRRALEDAARAEDRRLLRGVLEAMQPGVAVAVAEDREGDPVAAVGEVLNQTMTPEPVYACKDCGAHAATKGSHLDARLCNSRVKCYAPAGWESA